MKNNETPNNPPKTLIVSSYAPPLLGGAQNMYNLLRDADVNSYCILTSFYNINNISAQIGTWLKGEYIFYDSNTPPHTQSGSGETPTPLKNKRYVFIRKCLRKLKHLIKLYAPIDKLTGIAIIFGQIGAIVIKGRGVIKNKNIQSILAFSDYGPAMIGAYLLHKITKKKYTIFIFDIYKGNFFLFPGNQLANFFEKRMFKAASTIIVNNEGTREFYVQRYGSDVAGKIVNIPNSSFPDAYEKLHSTVRKESSVTNITFTGHVGWPQAGALLNLVRAIDEMKETQIHLYIYSPSPKEYLKELSIEESEKITISVASPLEMPEIQHRADILFIPLAWNTKSQSIIDTATPTKMTDYLAAGKPILVHAPQSTFLVRYAKENKFAAIIDEENIELLKSTIMRLTSDKSYCKELVENAQKTFFRNHDASVNAPEFQKIFLGGI